MLRWIKKKCRRRNKKEPRKQCSRFEVSCHEGIDFHIYEEAPTHCSPKVELAYSIVSLVDKMNAEQQQKKTRQHRRVPSTFSEIICSLCEKPLPGTMDVPDHVICRCSGLSSFRSSDCSSSDRFSWLDYDRDEVSDLRRRHPDLNNIHNRFEPLPRSRQPIYISFQNEETERRLLSDDSGGFFDTDNSGHSTDSSLDNSLVNNLDSLDLTEFNFSRTYAVPYTPRMGCRVIRRTRSAHESFGSTGKLVSIALLPSAYLTPSRLSKPIPVCGVHRSTDKFTFQRSSLKRRHSMSENMAGKYASIRRGLQCYGQREADMGYEPASTDEEEVCINVVEILGSKKARGKKCLMNQFSELESTESSINDMNKGDVEFFV